MRARETREGRGSIYLSDLRDGDGRESCHVGGGGEWIILGDFAIWIVLELKKNY